MSPTATLELEAESNDPMLGRLALGRYRVIDALAQGGMGVVYLGRTEGAEGFSRPVVIKRVLPQLLGDPSIGKMFVREARILANLRHPGIVGVIDFGEEDRAYIMVLEYVHGYDAGQWLGFLRRRGRRVPPDVAMRIVIQVLDALHYAHNLKRADGGTAQVVHRDISPGNILLDTEGHVRLSDFGIARIDNEAAEYRTQETTFRGKFGYAHPSLLSRGEPSPKTDVYSAAVVLFQLLTGVNPFRGGSAIETVNRVVNLPTPRLSEHWPHAPPELEDLLLRAMSRGPNEGFNDAQSFADALRKRMSRTEADVAVDMVEILGKDFRDLPAMLERSSLEDRDKAWRISIPGPSPTALRSTPPAGAVSEAPTISGATGEETVPGAAAVAGPPTAPASKSGSGQKLVFAAVVVSLLALAGVAALFLTQNKEPVAGPRYVVVSKDAVQSEGSRANAPDEPPRTSAERDAPEARAAETSANPSNAPAVAVDQRSGSNGEKLGTAARKPDPGYFTQVFSRRQGAVQSCFASSPDDQAMNLEVVFKVDTQGRVVTASLSPSGLAGTSTGRCVLGVARSTSFGPLTESATFRIPIQAKRN
jgi:eukaryotic-like serine/threonine-protein kinase